MSLLSFQTTITGGGGAGGEAAGRDRVAVVALSGELDVAGTGLLEHELARVVHDHDPTTLVLDLAGLEFMDSTGLRLVVLADERARAEDRRLTLVRGREDVQRIFELTGMTERLHFVDTVAEATA